MHGPSLPGVCHAEELHYLFSPTLWGMRNTLPSNTDRCEATVDSLSFSFIHLFCKDLSLCGIIG